MQLPSALKSKFPPEKLHGTRRRWLNLSEVNLRRVVCGRSRIGNAFTFDPSLSYRGGCGGRRGLFYLSDSAVINCYGCDETTHRFFAILRRFRQSKKGGAARASSVSRRRRFDIPIRRGMHLSHRDGCHSAICTRWHQRKIFLVHFPRPSSRGVVAVSCKCYDILRLSLIFVFYSTGDMSFNHHFVIA